MTRPLNEGERVSKYWICNDCAKAKKWTAPQWAVTVLKGLCGWCDRKDESTLTPVVDFNGPGKEAQWD